MSPAMSKTLHPTDDASAPETLSDSSVATDAQPPEAAPEEKKPAPNAIVTRAQCDAARESGTWTHDDASTALWLNSTVAAKGQSAEAVAETLALYGVEVR